MEGKNTPNKIIVHHTGDPTNAPQFDAVNALHKTKFNELSTLGYYVAYHLFVEKDGSIRRARADGEAGPHTKHHNFDAIAICLAGDFNTQSPTAEQITSLNMLLAGELSANGINPTEIYPHRHFNPTTCYGTNLTDDWARTGFKAYVEETILILQNMVQTLQENQANNQTNEA